MKYALLAGWMLLLGLCHAVAQPSAPQEDRFTISGYIKDGTTGEELLYANVYEPSNKLGTTSNLYGFYSMTLPSGTFKLTFSYLGYQVMTREVTLSQNITLNIELIPESSMLEEIVVTDKVANEAIQETGMSRIDLPIEDIKKMPALLGEPDVIKTIQAMPGVSSAGEGTSAFFVRGGSADQNLILIDEAPVYDVSHLFGIFSVFNSDIIKSAELYKGGVPAKYGGRLSSLLEVTTRDGNSKQLSGSGGIGILAAKGTLEGPIIKDKASFIVAGRRSYADLFMKNMDQFDGNTVSFHDLNAKVNWKATNKDRFFLSGYTGRDVMNFGDDFSMDWGNTTTTFRWNHLFNERLFSNLTVLYSDFGYELNFSDPVQGFVWKANQKEYSIKEDVSYFITPDLTVKFGYQGIYRHFTPGNIRPSDEEQSVFRSLSLQEQYALDHSLYVGVEHKITNRLSIDYGLRYSLFQNVGSGTVYEYSDPQDNINREVIDSSSYGRLEVIKNFHNPEPRIAARYLIDDKSSVKASYNRMVQYIHLISNSTVPIPFATWAPSSPSLDPQKSDQVAAGYFRNFDDNTYEFSVEAYYKRSRALTEFADNAALFFNEHLSTEFRQGDATSYGLELFLRKNKGDLRGFASYTWSKTEMEVNGVNNNQPFAASHDRRHNFNLALAYDISDTWSLGGAFTYATGRPITLPTGRYDFDGYQANYYSERNGYRLPDFHRLDLSATYEPRKNKSRRWQNSLVVGVYNAYNQQNPFTIYTRTKQDDDGNIIGDGTEKEARLVYLFGALPYVTWNFKF